MNNVFSVFIKSLLLGSLIFAIPALCANSENVTLDSDDNYSGGYLKLGFGYKSRVSPYAKEKNGFATFIDGRYQWQSGFYLEGSNGANALNQRSNGNAEINEYFNFGYNFLNTANWNFDANVVHVHGKVNLGFGDGVNPERSFNIYRKMTDMLGIRATGHFEQTKVQFELAPHSFNDEYDDGLYASVWLSRQWQIKNWSFYGSVGAQYRSKEIIEYYYDLDSKYYDLESGAFDNFRDFNTALSGFDHYKPSSGVNLTTQVGVSYPLSENWLLESYFKYTDIADSIADSPMMFLYGTSDGHQRSKHIAEAGVMLSYVF